MDWTQFDTKHSGDNDHSDDDDRSNHIHTHKHVAKHIVVDHYNTGIYEIKYLLIDVVYYVCTRYSTESNGLRDDHSTHLINVNDIYIYSYKMW